MHDCTANLSQQVAVSDGIGISIRCFWLVESDNLRLSATIFRNRQIPNWLIPGLKRIRRKCKDSMNG